MYNEQLSTELVEWAAQDKLCDEIEQLQKGFIQLKEERFASDEYISDNIRQFVEGAFILYSS
ncbi:hypothetical protein HHL23_04070 [Chryseobacterium sp. RP-3-3]|uniref:Uncharacterized protein n=1 Tax=Chryseobacterium antibioticum TaxID=2728847 RepID=A0A7Y0FQR8_9FLAO|nr:hypothetical protein [Chryseobacterium antibioticum]NML68970.1 hypothetical protein [Chryseobacterium antibioticum]